MSYDVLGMLDGLEYVLQDGKLWLLFICPRCGAQCHHGVVLSELVDGLEVVCRDKSCTPEGSRVGYRLSCNTSYSGLALGLADRPLV